MTTPEFPKIKAAREALAEYDALCALAGPARGTSAGGIYRFEAVAHLRAALTEADKMREWAERAARDENANAAELAALTASVTTRERTAFLAGAVAMRAEILCRIENPLGSQFVILAIDPADLAAGVKS